MAESGLNICLKGRIVSVSMDPAGMVRNRRLGNALVKLRSCTRVTKIQGSLAALNDPHKTLYTPIKLEITSAL